MKYIYKFLIIFLVCFSFISCNKKSEIIDDTIVEKPMEELFSSSITNDVVIEKDENLSLDTEIKTEFLLHSDYIYNSDIDWTIDLNGDSINELIFYNIEIKDGEFIPHLIINDIDYGKMIDLYEPLIDNFFIVDVDDSDNFYEIIVSTYGPSDDLESQWFRYIDNKLICLGNTSMMPNNLMYFNSDYSITIYSRTDIFGTNFIPLKYFISNNKLKVLESDFYEFGLMNNISYYTNIDLFVHDENKKNSNVIILDKGTIFNTTKTDNKNWVNIIVDEKEYWLYINNFCLPENNDIFIEEAIGNLILAD